MERYESLREILQHFVEKDQTLFIGSPILRHDYKPHNQVMAIGVLFKTPATLHMLKVLWDRTICRLIISLLEGEVCEIITTLENETIFIYTEKQIMKYLNDLPGKKSLLSLYLETQYEGYRERLIILDRMDA